MSGGSCSWAARTPFMSLTQAPSPEHCPKIPFDDGTAGGSIGVPGPVGVVVVVPIPAMEKKVAALSSSVASNMYAYEVLGVS